MSSCFKSLRNAGHRRLWTPILVLFLTAGLAAADGDVTFVDIAADPASGLAFMRAPSMDAARDRAILEGSLERPLSLQEIALRPYNTGGQPGVAILDYDGDGDLDLYLTNGPGAANSLFQNRLVEDGVLRFTDVAIAAGVDATDQDGTGVCYGDTDNDGDPDLLVLGRSEDNRLFENRGDGTFARVHDSGLEGGGRSSPSCSMGDVDGDGLLDVVIANSFDHATLIACLAEPFAHNEHNQLMRNLGGNRFADASAVAGIEDLAGFPPEHRGGAGITWATTVVDVDLDGDQDVIFADDQCAMPSAARGGLDRGFVHVLHNDGSGHFTDSPVLAGPYATGSWMGLAAGDLDCDGTLDLMGSNFGDYGLATMGIPYELGEQATRVLYGNGDGTFADPGIGALGSSVFGWGNAIFDYDNDGDLDVLYHGGLDFVTMPADNPGVILRNRGCGGGFEVDLDAIVKDHRRRVTQAVAIGDLDRDGFVDVVTASPVDAAEDAPFVPAPSAYGAIFDDLAFFVPVLAPTPDGFVWTGAERTPGTLTVELSRRGGDSDSDSGADSDSDGGDSAANGSITVGVAGSVGLTPGGGVNRSGIGAILSFTPDGGQTVMQPILGGASFASQHALEAVFGLGDAEHGTLEVLWPGGVRNRLYDVAAGARIVVPEIPCDHAAVWPNLAAYRSCVRRALDDLEDAGSVSRSYRNRLFASAVRAYHDSR